MRLREDEQRNVLKQLDNAQRGRLVEIAGKEFDLSRLGKVAFKSPEIHSSGPWINSSPAVAARRLRVKSWRSTFWAFG